MTDTERTLQVLKKAIGGDIDDLTSGDPHSFLIKNSLALT